MKKAFRPILVLGMLLAWSIRGHGGAGTRRPEPVGRAPAILRVHRCHPLSDELVTLLHQGAGVPARHGVTLIEYDIKKRAFPARGNDREERIPGRAGR